MWLKRISQKLSAKIPTNCQHSNQTNQVAQEIKRELFWLKKKKNNFATNIVENEYAWRPGSIDTAHDVDFSNMNCQSSIDKKVNDN